MTKVIQPTYITKLPSSGKEVKFRPFTVKEEKALLLALQEDSIETVTEAIRNTISACTSLDVDNIPYYDTEYVFLQIRSKSVGELIDLVGSCECSKTAKTNFEVDIGDTIVSPEPVESLSIKIPDTNYTVTVVHPTITDFASLVSSDGESAIGVVSNCIKSIITDDEVMDWSPAEKLEFVESMTTKQQKDISKFLKEMPMTKLPTKYVCSACGKEHVGFLSGYQNFFI